MIKYIAIVFFEDTKKAPLRFERWINEQTISKGQFQRFINQKHSGASYANLYDKNSRKFATRLKF